MPLLEIRNLRIAFPKAAPPVEAVQGVSLAVDPGETLGLVGESGSGKTLTALAIARLLPATTSVSGQVLLEGRDTLSLSQTELRRLRGGTVAYVFQDPGVSLNPVLRIGTQIKEPLKLHRPEIATNAEVVRLLTLVGLRSPEQCSRAYPHELSGGMRQRAAIAMAIAGRPKLLIADEPTTALDATVQAQIIDLLHDLKQQLGMALLLISHNLPLVRELADRIAVMQRGKIVETGPAARIVTEPVHPYTRALLDAAPRLGSSKQRPKTVAHSP